MSKTRTQDSFYKKAKREGYLARSIYKLEEIFEKYPKLNSYDNYLDLGSSPGSWSQFLLKNKKKVVGVDLVVGKVHHENFTFFQMDIHDLELSKLPFKPQVTLSDMAPNTTGIKDKDQLGSLELLKTGLEIAVELKSKFFLTKVFESSFMHVWLKTLEGSKKNYKIIKPKASISRSSYEIYILFNFT